jgi:hypothetical protein
VAITPDGMVVNIFASASDSTVAHTIFQILNANSQTPLRAC